MKVSLYFFDDYTNVSIWIAALLWPIFYYPFYKFIENDKRSRIKNILYSVFCALVMASFFSLTFSRTIQEYLIFFIGVGFLVFGSLLALSTNTNRRIYFIIGMISTVISGVILWFFREKVYKTKFPDTKGRLDTIFSIGGLIWNAIMAIMYIYILK
tara:strand:+ start:1488 stop:1955 length:468 start_codon:yes stop_codon:yes gene_type:complete